MGFAGPIWLWLLLPWLAVVVFVLRGRRRRVAVPFLQLWRGPIEPRRVTRAWEPPAVWVMLLLAAGLLAIVSASGLGVRRERIAQTNPPVPGIANAAVRGGQVMVTVVNPTTDAAATLAVNGQSRTIDLPAVGQSRKVFVDLPGAVDRVRLAINDGKAIELQRRQAWPRVEARSALPEPVRRVIEVYAQHRPSSADSPRVAVASTVISGRAIVLPTAGRPMQPVAATAIDHPLTRGVDWPAALQRATAAATTPPGWTPLVRLGNQTVLAVRESPERLSPERQVWIGFDSPDFPRSADFVVFWTNALDFAGQGGETFEPAPGATWATGEQPVNEAKEAGFITFTPVLAMGAVLLIIGAGVAIGRYRASTSGPIA